MRAIKYHKESLLPILLRGTIWVREPLSTLPLRRHLLQSPRVALMVFFILSALLVTSVWTQDLIESSSFGYRDKVSTNGYEIPGWQVLGEGQTPQLLSDKVVLTPPYPGNTRGSLWADTTVRYGDWSAELEFRASGPDRGSGNLQLWYAQDGRTNVGTSSLYTVGKFDGMVIVVDQYGGKVFTPWVNLLLGSLMTPLGREHTRLYERRQYRFQATSCYRLARFWSL